MVKVGLDLHQTYPSQHSGSHEQCSVWEGRREERCVASDNVAWLQRFVSSRLDAEKLSMREEAMTGTIFKIMGGFAIGFAALLFVGGILTVMRYPPHSRLELIRPAAIIAVLIAGGLGLLYLKKWAALIVSLSALWVASWEIRDALHPTPGDANWLGFVFAILLAVPSILTGVYWRTWFWPVN